MVAVSRWRALILLRGELKRRGAEEEGSYRSGLAQVLVVVAGLQLLPDRRQMIAIRIKLQRLQVIRSLGH